MESVDGEAELDVVLPEEPVSFLYELWRSTANAKIESFEDFKMAQFVFLQRKQSRLLCKVRQLCMYIHIDDSHLVLNDFRSFFHYKAILN